MTLLSRAHACHTGPNGFAHQSRGSWVFAQTRLGSDWVTLQVNAILLSRRTRSLRCAPSPNLSQRERREPLPVLTPCRASQIRAMTYLTQ